MRDYDKDRVEKVNWPMARAKADEGWLIARQSWQDNGQYVFLATTGTFDAKDLTTGWLEYFLVAGSPDGKYRPWHPSDEDCEAEDWMAISRQAVTRMNEQRLLGE